MFTLAGSDQPCFPPRLVLVTAWALVDGRFFRLFLPTPGWSRGGPMAREKPI